MMILAVDTSGDSGSVALLNGSSLMTGSFLPAEGRRHAQTLVGEVDRVLAEASLSPIDVDVVAVSIGPGSFTGLRVGCVFAKTFAWCNQARLAAVDTLQAWARHSQLGGEVIRVISDAQRKEVFCRDYDAHTLNPISDLGIRPLKDVAEPSGSGSLQVTGPGVSQFEGQLPAASCEYVPLPEPALLAPDVGAIAELYVAAGDLADVAALEPVYVRRSYAEEKRDQAV